MKVIIPVAGYGSRLRPHTFSTAKALLHVAGKPILSHVLAPIIALNPEEVVFVIGFRGDEIQEYVEQNFSFTSRFVRQDKLLGLGYAVSLGLSVIPDGPVLILLGDTIVEVDLGKFAAAGDNVLGVREVPDPHRFGIAEIQNNHILSLEEKPVNPKSNFAIVGLYYFHNSRKLRHALDEHVRSGVTNRGEVQFTDALEQLLLSGEKFTPFEIDSWHDCGKKETVIETNRYLLDKLAPPTTYNGSTIIPPVFIAPGAIVTNCVLGPYVAISEGAVIQHSVVRNTIVGPDAQIQDAVLDNSLIGRNAVVRGTGR